MWCELNLSPAPIRITLAGLPQPFASQSASKSPTHPAKPNAACASWLHCQRLCRSLDAHAGLTPTGDVLVTETRQNRIRLLRDTNGDGADVRKTFAGLKMEYTFWHGLCQWFLLPWQYRCRLKFPYTQGQQQIT